MGKTHNDEVYEEGVHDGKQGDLLGDIIMGSGAGDMIPGGEKDWEIYKKGYNYGVDHRHDSSNDDNSDDDCFIATVVYRDPNALEVQILRDFRDDVLRNSFGGRSLINFYYSGVGKKTAHIIETYTPLAIPIIKKGLDFLVKAYSRTR